MKGGRQTPNYLVSSTEGHYQQPHESVSHGQGSDEIVGSAVQSSLLAGKLLNDLSVTNIIPTTTIDIVHLIIYNNI